MTRWRETVVKTEEQYERDARVSRAVRLLVFCALMTAGLVVWAVQQVLS